MPSSVKKKAPGVGVNKPFKPPSAPAAADSKGLFDIYSYKK